jgi:hypothetical protein
VPGAPLDRLIAHPLDTVAFVGDFLELRIDYSVLRSMTGISGVLDGVAWRLTEDSGADVLRKYIGKHVIDAEIVEDDRITLIFEGEHRLDVSLRSEDRAGPEAAHFLPAHKDGRIDTEGMWIW